MILKQRWLALIIPILWIGFTLESPGGVSPANSQSSSEPQSTTAPVQAWQFRAFGTEPFWGVNVNPSGIVYSNLDGTKVQFPYVSPLSAVGRPEELVLFFDLGNKNFLTLIRNPCSDRMSDLTHTYQAIFVFENNVYEGCANPS